MFYHAHSSVFIHSWYSSHLFIQILSILQDPSEVLLLLGSCSAQSLTHSKHWINTCWSSESSCNWKTNIWQSHSSCENSHTLKKSSYYLTGVRFILEMYIPDSAKNRLSSWANPLRLHFPHQLNKRVVADPYYLQQQWHHLETCQKGKNSRLTPNLLNQDLHLTTSPGDATTNWSWRSTMQDDLQLNGPFQR